MQALVRFGLFTVLYLFVGVLVATSVLGDPANYFSGLSSIEELAELILAVLLWPLVLLDVNVNIGDVNIGGGDSADAGGGDSGGGDSGGEDSGGGSGGGNGK